MLYILPDDKPNSGWSCPKCGSAHSPDTKTCPSPATPTRPPTTYPPLPTYAFPCWICGKVGVHVCVTC